jgi:hypothetical protein
VPGKGGPGKGAPGNGKGKDAGTTPQQAAPGKK